ncbi:MAG TPA: sterol desaturase family protein [Pyrinomonadaceae bacterium]|jgi:sterol desaturase/sphingolipid hydroxylase (fatty acid hydroxylase superfamily)
MKGGGKVPSWLGGALVLGAFGALAWLERRRPLRAGREPKLRRAGRNLAFAAVGAAALRLTEKPVADRLTALVERRRWGLLKLARLPVRVEVALAVVLLDYTLYLWHVLTHRAPFLWRFHVVHHADLDLDATTALRFHFAELALSVPWRAAQILVLGVSPQALSLWQMLLMLSILFHHSNVRLPVRVERRLGLLFVTPRMHGIHHSAVRAETDSNWSSGLALWDRLHGTLRLDVPQDEVDIGVPAYRDPRELGLAELLAMPFGDERPTWLLNGDGPEPARAPSAAAPERLSA